MPLRSGSPLVDKNHQLYEGFLKVPSRLIAYTQQLERGSVSAESMHHHRALTLDRQNPYSQELIGELLKNKLDEDSNISAKHVQLLF